jgi:hypothetical protein
LTSIDTDTTYFWRLSKVNEIAMATTSLLVFIYFREQENNSGETEIRMEEKEISPLRMCTNSLKNFSWVEVEGLFLNRQFFLALRNAKL